MGLFNRNKNNGAIGPIPPDIPPHILQAHRQRFEGATPGGNLQERVDQLDADLNEVNLVLRALLQLLDEHDIVKSEVLDKRADQLANGETPEPGLTHSPPAHSSPSHADDPPKPVQPTFKQPFVAKRKWGEAADSDPSL